MLINESAHFYLKYFIISFLQSIVALIVGNMFNGRELTQQQALTSPVQ